MDIANILYNIDSGVTTIKIMRSLDAVINGSDYIRFRRDKYERLVQPPQIQDTIVGRNRLGVVGDDDHYIKSIEALKKLENNKDVIRIMTWNVSSWVETRRVLALVNRIPILVNRISMLLNIRAVSPTILCLQEDSDLNIDANDSTYNWFIGAYNRIGTCKANNTFNSVYIRKNSGVTFAIVDNGEYNIQQNNDEHDIQQNNDMHCGVFVNIIYKGEVLFLLANVQLDEEVMNGLDNMHRTLEIINSTGINNKIILGDMNSYYVDDYDIDAFEELNRLQGLEVDNFAVTNYIQSAGWVDSFNKYFESNNIDKDKRTVPLNTTLDGGRVDFIFMYRKFDLPILGCYKLNAEGPRHAPIVMDLYYPA